MSDLTKLSQRMLGLSSRVTDLANAKTQSAAKAFFETVVNRTPVDTGQAISNWKVGLNYEPRGVTPARVPGSQGSTAGANRRATLAAYLPTIAKRVTGQTIYIINTVPYIGRLNAGWSRQAPAGFIDAARAAAYSAAARERLNGR